MSGYAAVVKTSVSCLSLPGWIRLLDSICDVARNTHWLRSECGMIIYDFLKYSSRTSIANEYYQEVISRLHANGLAKSAEGAAIWAFAKSSFEQITFPDGVWHKNDPLSKHDKSILASVMRGNHKETDEVQPKHSKGVKAGSAQRTLSFAWDVIINLMVANVEKSKGNLQARENEFRAFWEELVDGKYVNSFNYDHLSLLIR